MDEAAKIMKLVPASLQNASNWAEEKPTIIILAGSPEWAEAHKKWLDGKNPTDSPEWKKGVYMTFQEAFVTFEEWSSNT